MITDLKADAVFEGGGIKGLGLVGALSVAEEKGYKWQNVAGTSAEAIVAALVAAEYSAAELKNIMGELDYSKFKDVGLIDKIPVGGPLASLIFEKGIYEGKFLESWIRDLLQKKGVKTFGDLIIKESKDDEQYRFKLRVIASDITQGRMLALPQDIADFGMIAEDLDVAVAVRMSMSIPFFYEPVAWQNEKTGGVSYIVDGGLPSNFPVWLFDTVEGETPAWSTFGFKLVEPDEGRANEVRGPIILLTALFSTMVEAHGARYIKDENFVRTIPIPTLGIGTAEFDISKDRSEALYQSGSVAAEQFSASWSFKDYIEKYRKGKKSISRRKRLTLNQSD